MGHRDAAGRPAALLAVATLLACGSPPQRTAARPAADTKAAAATERAPDTARVAILGEVSGAPAVQSTVTATPWRRDEAAIVAAVAVARTLMPPDAAPPMPLVPEVRGVCDSLAAVWESVPGAVVRRGDTLVRPGDVLGDSTLARWGDRPTGPAVTACFVRGEAEEGVDATVRERLSWMQANPYRGKNGWIDLDRMSADGPEGSEMHYQRGLTRCRVTQEWDGGDDGDSTYVARPFYRERLVCWRHWRPVMYPDTMYHGQR